MIRSYTGSVMEVTHYTADVRQSKFSYAIIHVFCVKLHSYICRPPPMCVYYMFTDSLFYYYYYYYLYI